MKTRKKTLPFFCLPAIYLLCFTGLHAASEIYFKDTDHQLEVIRINGKNPGTTILIFGGIHGDEPGGHFAPEILSGIQLAKGNLIIVPRVNFPSIILNRREIYGDMNRKFIPQKKPNDPDSEVVELLKNLMKEADVFVNLHDAFGFHRETYISSKYNQTQYGQSLIIDSANFFSTKLNRQIPLAVIGKRILERANSQIENKNHHFGFWDHDSIAKQTKFPEMKKSATYYALTTYSIPAFGLETSKELPTLAHKVRYQLIVLKEIMLEFGLEFTLTEPELREPLLYWVEFLKNGRDVIRVNGNTNLRLNPKDTVIITSVFSNYKAGLSADISRWGSLSDLNKAFVFSSSADIVIKKNHIEIGKIFLREFKKDSIREIEADVNGVTKTIPNWGKIDIEMGQYFKIRGTQPRFNGLYFDVRGISKRTGKKDDSNIEIRPENLLPTYSFNGNGTIYFVKIYLSNTLAGGFQVEIKPKTR